MLTLGACTCGKANPCSKAAVLVCVVASASGKAARIGNAAGGRIGITGSAATPRNLASARRSGRINFQLVEASRLCVVCSSCCA